MEKKSWAKLIIAVFVAAAITVGIYLRWRLTRQGSDPLAGWGQGNLRISERVYYSDRIDRIIENWQETALDREPDREGRMKESYTTFLVIDTAKQAIGIEQNGQIRQHNYAELPGGMKWKLYRSAPEGDSELPNPVRLKIRGIYSRRLSAEKFYLVGAGRGAGYLSFQFNASSRGSDYGSGRFVLPPHNSKPEKTQETEDDYGSLVVTDAEYERYRDSLAGSALPEPDGQSTQSEIHPALEENRASWLKAEKLLYIEVEKQVSNAGFELRELKVEPGPDFSAAHAELRATTKGFLRGIFGGYSLVQAYLKIDYLGNDVWYVKSHVNPMMPAPPRRRLDLEFLVCPAGDIAGSQRSELIEKGRDIQQPARVQPSKWQATLPNGVMVELLGICEHPSDGKQWWRPDGSLLEEAPFSKSTCGLSPRHLKAKAYCIAWRSSSVDYQSSSTAGSIGSGSGMMVDKYGSYIRSSSLGHTIQLLPEDMETTSVEFGFAIGDWQTPLIVNEDPGEMNFLGKQRIILYPPEIENGQSIVRCKEGSKNRTRKYQTDFAILLTEGQTSKVVSLGRYEEDFTDDRVTGLLERKFTIDDLSPGQIEGVCFRYRPLTFVKFNNVSLVPGKDMGFSIELEEQ